VEATSSVFCGGRDPPENYPERPRSRRDLTAEEMTQGKIFSRQ